MKLRSLEPLWKLCIWCHLITYHTNIVFCLFTAQDACSVTRTTELSTETRTLWSVTNDSKLSLFFSFIKAGQGFRTMTLYTGSLVPLFSLWALIIYVCYLILWHLWILNCRKSVKNHRRANKTSRKKHALQLSEPKNPPAGLIMCDSQEKQSTLRLKSGHSVTIALIYMSQLKICQK